MADSPSLPTTQRAYTLRLRGVDPNDHAWRNALWATHEAVNKGAKAFGDWLLTLRGGLSHDLAEPPPPAKHKKRADEETAALRKNRRVLLALSWLSVEDERGAPSRDELVVAYGDKCKRLQDNQESRDHKVVKALRGILSKRKLPAMEINSWVRDCEGSLKASIREDAVWVNRSACFDNAVERLNGALTQEAVWDLLKPVFGSAEKMLASATLGEDEDQTDKPASKGGDDETATSAKDATSEESGDDDDAESGGTRAKDLVKKAGKWLSLRYKAEDGADYTAVADRYDRIAQAVEGVSGTVTGDELIGNITQALGRDGDGRKGIVEAVGYTGTKHRGTFFSRLNEINPAKNYTAADLKPLLESTRKRTGDLRKTSASRQADPKGPRPWSVLMLQGVADACGFKYDSITPDGAHSDEGSAGNENDGGGANQGEYSVMLDHAMRRVSIAHSWIKRAEAARAKFENDRARIARVPVPVRDWLDEFFRLRGRKANAAEGYSVRRRALGGKHAKAWKAVVAAWAGEKCKSEEQRRDAVRQVQSDWDDEEKFGYSDLFIALADDDALFMWKDGPQALIDYVAAKDAESRMRRYKVPAYRHPEAYHNPVFTDFGYSRWRVEYEAHKVRNRAAKTELAVEQKRQELASHPASSDSQKKAESALKSTETRLKKARAEVARLGGSAKIRLRLWNGREFVWSDELSGGITWHSLRLRNDLALNSTTDAQPTENRNNPLTRADRLGLAAAQPGDGEGVSVANVFLEKHWNARLQAPRRELEARAKRIDKKPALIRWFVTFSPRLEPRGPFVEYAGKHGIRLDQKRDGDRQLIRLAPDPKRRKRNEWRGLAYPFWHPDHKQGTIGHAKILLSRLPGLRVLSFDLGHRFAAGCAVWESLSLSNMNEEIDGRKIVAGGIREEDLFCHTSHIDERGKERTAIYRRIGEDHLRDAKTGKPTDDPHPAPWARLDRHFVIKLQGEERPPRFASDAEHKLVQKLEENLRRARGNKNNKNQLPWRVDELMSEAVRSIRSALGRHGDLARIAYAFRLDSLRLTPGGGSAEHTPQTRKTAIVDALVRWHEMAVSARWKDDDALNQWNREIRPLIEKTNFTEPPPLEGDDANDQKREKKIARWKQMWEGLRTTITRRSEEQEDLTERSERKADSEAIAALLSPVAEALRHDQQKCNELSKQWSGRWDDDDGKKRTKDDFEHTLIRNEVRKVIGSRTSPKKGKETVTGWYAHLRLLTDWIMGWHLPGARTKFWNRNVGGLSLTRIATMKSLYQLHKAFAMRPTPVELRGAPEKGESNAGVAQSILHAMERMREQRVKQIASRIVEAALGVGIERKPVWDEVKRKWRYPKRPRQLLYYEDEQGKHGDPRFKTCHAVVIENLRNYRPDELQTRRENRRLMNWSAGKVRKYLEESCQLHGLHLREVLPNYTSRQDSRIGLPGVRCVDVATDSVTGEPRAYWWKKALSAAKKKSDEESKFLVDLAANLAKFKANGKLPKTVRLPRRGGDLFVAALPQSCNAQGHTPCPLCKKGRALQADINAAANIGLRALLDPDFAGKWWYVPCRDVDGVPHPDDKVKGSACFGSDPAKFGSLRKSHAEPSRQKCGRRAKKETVGEKPNSKEITNYWADVSAQPLQLALHGDWLETGNYWKDVKRRVIEALRIQNGLGANPASLAPELSEQ